jgi:hypothetical protein
VSKPGARLFPTGNRSRPASSALRRPVVALAAVGGDQRPERERESQIHLPSSSRRHVTCSKPTRSGLLHSHELGGNWSTRAEDASWSCSPILLAWTRTCRGPRFSVVTVSRSHGHRPRSVHTCHATTPEHGNPSLFFSSPGRRRI